MVNAEFPHPSPYGFGLVDGLGRQILQPASIENLRARGFVRIARKFSAN